MTYEFTKDAPAILDEKKYINKANNDLQQLLLNHSTEENYFQSFFEHNPCYVPGARDEFSGIGPSGHGPYLEALIRQPKISGLIDRIPDFMWLASDSAYFVPVIVEIEAPNKKYFRKDGNPTSEFIHAKHQLEEWQTILSRPENILRFYQDFAIPQYLRDLTFNPHYILVFGRRDEFQKDTILIQKRAAMIGKNQTIMSYDRINPQIARRNFVCCDVKNGKYIARHLGPTFKIGPYEDQLFYIENLVEAVDLTSYISEERKQFLKQKIPYCLKFIEEERQGKKVKIRQKGEFQMEE